MFTTFLNWFNSSDWMSLVDYLVVVVLARYIPSITPIYEKIKSFFKKIS